MEYKKSGSGIFIRLDEGDEIIGSLKTVCGKEKIDCAYFFGIGACRKAEISHFDTKERKYHNRKLEGMLEIVSMIGNITVADGKPLVHAHISLGLKDFSIVGGHLVSVEANPTCEITLIPLSMKIERRLDEKTGLKLQRF